MNTKIVCYLAQEQRSTNGFIYNFSILLERLLLQRIDFKYLQYVCANTPGSNQVDKSRCFLDFMRLRYIPSIWIAPVVVMA